MTDTNMTCDRLADALDDILQGRDRVWRTHLASCEACRIAVADVRAICDAARTLGPIPPPPQVWRRVEQAVDGPATDGGRWSWRTWQPLAAAASITLIVSSLVWLGAQLGRPGARPATDGAPRAGTTGTERPDLTGFRLAEAQYSYAIARLEDAAAAAGPRALDETTRVTLRSSIDDVDAAIGEARDALAREPDDELSQESLLEALGSKVTLLQDTVALLVEDEHPEERTP